MGLRQIGERMGRNKLLCGIVALFLVSISYAAWSIWSEDSFVARIISTGETPLFFSTEFSDIEIDTSNNSMNVSNTGILRNTNGNISVVFGIETTKEDFDDECTSFEEDCEVNSFITIDNNDYVLSNGMTKDINNGDYNITTWISCVRFSCNQNISVTINATG